MTPTTTENIAKLFTYYSTWVAFVASFVAGYWLQLDPAEQVKILAQWPVLKHYAPIFAFVAFAAARVKAQAAPMPTFTPPPAGTGVSGDVMGRINDFQPTVPVLSTEQIDALLKADQILKQRLRGGS